jgi:hypothetical protein
MKKVLVTVLCVIASVSFCWAKVDTKEKHIPVEKSIKERIEQRFIDKIGTETAIQQKLKEGTETETSIERKKEKIVKEEMDREVAILSEKMKPLDIPIQKIEAIAIEMQSIPYFEFVVMSPKEIEIWKQKIQVIGVEGLTILIQKLDTTDIPKLAILITKAEAIDIKSLAVLTQRLDITDIPKLAILLTKVETLDVSGLAKHIEKVFGFILDETEFFEAWKKKDVQMLARIIQNIKTRKVEFFTAWGNYQNFADINWNRQEPFDYRQVLITDISYNWRDRFKPTNPIILTINYGLDTPTIRSLLELIKENKDKIKMVILPWGQADVNNFDNKDISTYPKVAEWCDRLFYSIKEVYPEVPIYLTVCFTPTMDAWLKSFKSPYDGLAVWNITYVTQGNHKKVYDILSKYNKNLILSGVFQCNPDQSWKPWEEVKQSFTQKDLDNLRKIGYKGVIFMTNVND